MEIMKLQIEIKEEKTGQEVVGWYLMLKYGEGGFSGLPIYSANEMRQIAKTLVEKADKIESEKINE